jgi:hypothetical protein
MRLAFHLKTASNIATVQITEPEPDFPEDVVEEVDLAE